MAETLKTIDDINRTKTVITGTDRLPMRDDTGDFKTTFDDLQANLTTSVPAGTVIESAAISAPTGYLACNGAAVSRTTYDVLYAAITANLGAFTVSIASPGEVTLNAHGLSTGSCVELTTTGALPTGLAVNTNYYAIYVNANVIRLATSAANAIAGTAINTSGSQSGTHTLRHCPYGISTATNFLLPNRAAVVGVGAGSQTINTRAKTAVLGLVEEDQIQGHKHELTAPRTTSGSGTDGVLDDVFSTNVSISSWMRGPLTDGTNGTPRIGTTTRENRIGMNYYIKY